MIQEIIQEYENRIRKYTGDEPLDNWLEYISWIERNKANLDTSIKINWIYQRCIDKIKSFGDYKYRNDERFIKIFIFYALNYDKTPSAIFDFMYKHNYGEFYADFYIEWSKLYEERKLFSKAKGILRLGIDKKAQPTQKLKNEMDEIKKRIAIYERTTNTKKEVLAFDYFPINPLNNSGVEYEFEEMRAHHYLTYNHKIETLQKRLEEVEQKVVNKENVQNSNSSSRNPSRKSSKNSTTIWSPDDTIDTANRNQQSILATNRNNTYYQIGNNTTVFNDNNLTNVTHMTRCTSKFNNDVNDMSEDEDEDTASLKSRTMPSNLETPETLAQSINSVSIANQSDKRQTSFATTSNTTLFNMTANRTAGTLEVGRNIDQIMNQTERVERTELTVNDEPTTTNLSATMNISVLNNFEPPMASTCNLKTLIKKFNDNCNDFEHTAKIPRLARIDDNTQDFEVTAKIPRINNSQDYPEFEQTTNVKIKITESSINKLLAEDITENANGSKTTNKLWSENCETKAMSETMSTSWDYKYIDVNNSVCPVEANLTQNNTMFNKEKTTKISQGENVTKAGELLTNENLEKTFNEDYYRIYFCESILVQTANEEITSNNISKIINMSRLAQHSTIKMNEMKSMNASRIQEESTQMKNTLILETKKPDVTISHDATKINNLIDNVTNNETTVASKDHIDETIVEESTEASACTDLSMSSVMNDTIMHAINNPFNIDVKNRLLNRPKIADYLKTNPKYRCMLTNAPIIKSKTSVFLKDAEEYKVISEVGSGAYAKIFLIEKKNAKKCNQALKVDTQPTAWEFYITERLGERLENLLKNKQMKVDVTGSFVRMEQFFRYKNGCFSVMNYYKNGTLLDLINYHLKAEQTFPYWFVIYLTLELLYIIDFLQKCQIIHADIKPDNLLINQLPERLDYFDPTRAKCLVLIDFNRSIDLSMFPDEAEFTAKVDNKSLLCCEMQNNKAWTYQIDFYGILSSIHCIIFKKYMRTFKELERNKIANSIPRCYDKVFARLFDTYLNLTSCKEIPDLQAEFIKNLENLFRSELSITAFEKSKKYLNALNDYFKNQ